MRAVTSSLFPEEGMPRRRQSEESSERSQYQRRNSASLRWADGMGRGMGVSPWTGSVAVHDDLDDVPEEGGERSEEGERG